MHPIERRAGGLRPIRLLAGVLVLVGWVIFAASASADIYTVKGVSVTGKGKSAKEAKRKAVAGGQAKALKQLLRRLTQKEDYDRLPAPKGKRLDALVKGYEVEQERGRARSYVGRLAFMFHPHKVQALLRRGGVSYVETDSKPILVLALWQEGDRLVLWDDPNPWREVWRRLNESGSLIDFLRPSGNLKDIRAVSAKQALGLDAEALAAIAQNYETTTVLIAHARVARGRVAVAVRRFNTVTGKERLLRAYSAANNAKSLSRVASKIIRDFEDVWKTANIVPSGATSSLTVRAPLQGLSYWIRLRDGLRQVKLIRKRRIVSLTPAMAVIEIAYAGRIGQLTEALRQNDIALRRGGADGDAEVWELRMIGSSQQRPDDRTDGGQTKPKKQDPQQ